MHAAGLRLFLYRWQMRAFVFLFPRFCGKVKNPIPEAARSRTVCLRACPDWAGRIPRFFLGVGENSVITEFTIKTGTLQLPFRKISRLPAGFRLHF